MCLADNDVYAEALREWHSGRVGLLVDTDNVDAEVVQLAHDSRTDGAESGNDHMVAYRRSDIRVRGYARPDNGGRHQRNDGETVKSEKKLGPLFGRVNSGLTLCRARRVEKCQVQRRRQRVAPRPD